MIDQGFFSCLFHRSALLA